MQYLGGKSRTCKQIAGYINQIRKPGQVYWEPFVGAGWVLQYIVGGERYASDSNWHLIEMWKALQNGWTPPKNVSEDDYREAQAGLLSPELTAFIGFGCSWSGIWFTGYAQSPRKDRVNGYALGSRKSLLEKSIHTKYVKFFHADFLECSHPAYNCLIYCDPPYNGTTGYGAVDPFDTGKFWARVRYLSEHGHTILVSEYNAPPDFSTVWQQRIKTDMNTKNGKDHRIEKLFRYGDFPIMQPELF